MCISLTPACLPKNPGQADEEHHAPDIQHASYLENKKRHCSVNRMHAYRSLKHHDSVYGSKQLFWSLCQPVKVTLAPQLLSAGHSYARWQPEFCKTQNFPVQLTKTPLIQPNFTPSFLLSMGTADSRSSERASMLPSLSSSTVSGTEICPPCWE